MPNVPTGNLPKKAYSSDITIEGAFYLYALEKTARALRDQLPYHKAELELTLIKGKAFLNRVF